jgi:hypothetical protein
MTLQEALATFNSVLLVIVGWFIRNWVTDVKADRVRDGERIASLEKEVSFIKGRLFGGIPHDVDDD